MSHPSGGSRLYASVPNVRVGSYLPSMPDTANGGLYFEPVDDHATSASCDDHRLDDHVPQPGHLSALVFGNDDPHMGHIPRVDDQNINNFEINTPISIPKEFIYQHPYDSGYETNQVDNYNGVTGVNDTLPTQIDQTDFTGISDTQPNQFDPPGFLYPQDLQQPLFGEFNSDIPTDWENFLSQMPGFPHQTPQEPTPEPKGKKRPASVHSDQQQDETPKKQIRRNPSDLIKINEDHLRTLENELQRFEKRDHLPSEKEFKAIAALTGLKVFQVAMWYGEKLHLQPKEIDMQTHNRSDIDPVIQGDILNYIQVARRKQCDSHHSRNAAGGKYPCTWECGYSTNSRDDWERHEEKKQPQNFWHCHLCHNMRQGNVKHKATFIAHRIDKFLPHAKSCHDGENAQDLRTRSKIPYRASFNRNCTFRFNNGKVCDHVSSTWRERKQHWFSHFDRNDSDDAPYLPHSPAPDIDDDDNEPYSGSKNLGTNPKFHSFPGASGTSTGQQSSRRPAFKGGGNSTFRTRGQALLTPEESDIEEEQMTRIPSCAANRSPLDVFGGADLATKLVIDVENHCIVDANPDDRYLAVKYAKQQVIEVKEFEPQKASLPPSFPVVERLPQLFQRALALARDMGFQFLWIDVFCTPESTQDVSDLIYQQARLILVIGRSSQHADQFWHFTCDFSHLNEVQSWARKNSSFHHLQQLGHGAYSVVDKVELRPGPGTFARKIVYRTNTKQALKACHLQEIEIMQKFRHPHIARFVAAYYDRSSFNILMSPVADCDLRQFLSNPTAYPEKQNYLPQWFMSLAEALSYMHRLHCRHKDIKPANILISGDTVLLTDFGTSLDFSTTSSSTSGGAFMTPKYCAPEVAAKGVRGRSADIFSLGCVFAEMITVDLGNSLEEMHERLDIEEDSRDRDATYHKHLPDLVSWLRSLMWRRPSDEQLRILRITEEMLNELPERRPRALAVTKALCPKDSCEGLRETATCHCCPMQKGQTSILKPKNQAAMILSSHSPSSVFEMAIAYLKQTRLLRGDIPSYRAAQRVMLEIFKRYGISIVSGQCPFIRLLQFLVQPAKRLMHQLVRLDVKISVKGRKSHHLTYAVVLVPVAETMEDSCMNDAMQIDRVQDVEMEDTDRSQLVAKSLSSARNVSEEVLDYERAQLFRETLQALAWRMLGTSEGWETMSLW